jgi:hypothetical protein
MTCFTRKRIEEILMTDLCPVERAYFEAVDKLRQRFADDTAGFEAEMERVEWAAQFISGDYEVCEPEHPFWCTPVGQEARTQWETTLRGICVAHGLPYEDPWETNTDDDESWMDDSNNAPEVEEVPRTALVSD